MAFEGKHLEMELDLSSQTASGDFFDQLGGDVGAKGATQAGVFDQNHW